MRRQADVIYIVHPFELGVQAGIHFEDDALGQFEPGRVVAHRSRGHQPSVLQNGDDFDQRHVELAVMPPRRVLRHFREMLVDIPGIAPVDAVATVRVGLVGRAEGDAVDLEQRAVHFRRGRRARPDADLEVFAALVRRRDASRQCARHFLGMAGAGETAHADVVAGTDEGSGLVRRHDLAAQGGVVHAGFAHF